MNSGLPKIKVCGVTRIQDLRVLAECGVDCVGLNFVPRSPRCLDLESGRVLSVEAARLGLSRVAVVMNAAEQGLLQIAGTVQPEFVQLHGSETPQDVGALLAAGYSIIKAVSWTGRDQERSLAAAWAGHPKLAAMLVDAYAPDIGGGSGKVARWDLLTPRPETLGGCPLILAGGLSGENVAAGIEATAADGVDTASGVEDSPGIKNQAMVEAFAKAAQAALQIKQRAAGLPPSRSAAGG